MANGSFQAAAGTGHVDDALARRNARVLACAQALGGANPAVVVSLGGLVGESLAPSHAYATVPISILHVGIAAGTIPAALLMARLGRRGGYLVGALIGVAAGCVAAFAISRASFAGFCCATFLAGLYAAYVNTYRFAAADTASAGFRTRAITWVMVGGMAAAVIGPQTVIWTRDLVPGVAFAGGFLGQAALALVSIAVVAALRTPPAPAPEPVDAPVAESRTLGEVARQPRFVLAVLAGIASFALMSLVMTAAPLAMVLECAHKVDDATLGIQWHILAMFGPSLVTGRIIERFGKPEVTFVGLCLIGLSAAVGLAGTSVAHFWTALVLLGIGWNFGFIGATAMVTECYRPQERAKVQAMNDFLVFGAVAISSFSSGALLGYGGWAAVNWVAACVVAIVAALLLADILRRPRLAGASA